MKVKVSELVGKSLDFAVCFALYGEAAHYIYTHSKSINSYSTDWSHAGPIIESERIQVFPHNGAESWCGVIHKKRDGYIGILAQDGDTPLIAAMRVYVLGMLGGEVEVPEVLL